MRKEQPGADAPQEKTAGAGPALTRRQVLGTGAVVTSAAATGLHPAEARTIRGKMPWAPGEANAPVPVRPGTYVYFTQQEAAFIEAAVKRLIPKDDLGPGAFEADVHYFLDSQLAGSYGMAERRYMLGPWRTGEKTQGYQSRMTPAQLYRFAIKAIDEHVGKTEKGQTFAKLSADKQDDLLKQLEAGKVELEGVSGKLFFDQLLQNTIEGFFSDPIHGGNRDMIGWKLIGFPGARYDYRPWVKQYNKRFPLPPVSIQGRPGWTDKKS